MEKDTIKILQSALPAWAVKPHPTKTNMTAIHPMAVIDVLNEAFGIGQWEFRTDYLQCNPWVQKTKNGERNMFMSAVKGTLIVPKHNIHIEQYGGSSNDDMGDALKGGATDALTKCASYLGVGASIYKGQGNQDAPLSIEEACAILASSKTNEELDTNYKALPVSLQKDNGVKAKGAEVRKSLG